MRIGFDIGGVISKHPSEFRALIYDLHTTGHLIFIITDMHDIEYVEKMLRSNSIPGYYEVYCADYKTHGEMCKAVLLKELKIDMFFDDFQGYLQWDSSFGPAPIRFLMMPDAMRPYWHKDWKTQDDSDFGRRVYSFGESVDNV